MRPLLAALLLLPAAGFAQSGIVLTLNGAGTRFLVYETDQTQGSGAGGNNIANGSLGLNLPPNTTGRRLTWIERR